MRSSRAGRISSLVAGAALVFGGFVAVVGSAPAGAATISGGDKGGADITVANGDVLSGTFTNVGTFTIPAGVTVTVDPGVPLSITATKIVIDGTLDGTGAGFAGGVATTNSGDNGIVGEGSGPGGGGNYGQNVHGSGGGGGGYGGAGGDGAFAEYPNYPTAPGAGGVTYGTDAGPTSPRVRWRLGCQPRRRLHTVCGRERRCRRCRDHAQR